MGHPVNVIAVDGSVGSIAHGEEPLLSHEETCPGVEYGNPRFDLTDSFFFFGHMSAQVSPLRRLLVTTCQYLPPSGVIMCVHPEVPCFIRPLASLSLHKGRAVSLRDVSQCSDQCPTPSGPP